MRDTQYHIDQLVDIVKILKEDHDNGADPKFLLRDVGTIASIVGSLAKDLTHLMEYPRPLKAANK